MSKAILPGGGLDWNATSDDYARFRPTYPASYFGILRAVGIGTISISRDRTTASADVFVATVRGKQTHGAMPWLGIDPVPVAAEIILAWQTIPSRQVNLSTDPAPVVSVTRVDAGFRHNIIAPEVRLEGTVRTASDAQRAEVLNRLQRTAEGIAAASGATAEVRILANGVPAGRNDEKLVEKAIPILATVAKDGKVRVAGPGYAADDFAVFSRSSPAVTFGLGAAPAGVEEGKRAPNHSPLFIADDAAIGIGLRALSRLVVAYGETGGFKAP